MYSSLSYHLSLPLVCFYFCLISYYMTSVDCNGLCFLYWSSSSPRVFLLTQILVKMILRLLRQILWIFRKVLLRFHNKVATLSRTQERETVLFFWQYCVGMSVWVGNFIVHFNQVLLSVHSLFSCSRQIFSSY